MAGYSGDANLLASSIQYIINVGMTIPALIWLDRWGRQLAEVLSGGGRILVAGNGGSAGEAQHMTAELVGRLRDDRAPLSAIALTSETSSLTAIANDYGYDTAFARQVRAHGRPGDVLLPLSTSGRGASVVEAARVARECGLVAWALTGPGSSPLAEASDEVVAYLVGVRNEVVGDDGEIQQLGGGVGG